MNNQSLTIHLPADVRAMLESLCKYQRRSRGQLLRLLIQSEYERTQEAKKK